MTTEERYQLQRTKKIINNTNNITDNYILSRIKIRDMIQEQESKEQMPKELIESIKKQAIKEIEDTFKK